MGQKVNPNGLRFGINKNWHSRWNSLDPKQTAQWLVQDDQIRKQFIAKYHDAHIDHIEIERTKQTIALFIYAAQPGLIIGQEGAGLVKARLDVNKIVGRQIRVDIQVILVEAPELCARIAAREIADAIEKRTPFRLAQKVVIKKVLKAGAKGIKTRVSGRLGGVEMAREEGYGEGVVPLTTLRADIDYALEEAHTTYGIIGVKVWINRGEIFGKQFKPAIAKPLVEQKPRREFDKNRKPRNNNNKHRSNDGKPRAPRTNSNKPETTQGGN